MRTIKKRATLRAVAKEAGVAISTASCILRNVDTGWSMHPETKQRVLDAAGKLGYQPNATARALATQRNEYIGILIPKTVPDGWNNSYFSSLLCGAEKVAHKKGFGLVVGQYDEADINDFILPRHVKERSVDGVILTGYATESIIKQFQDYGITCVAAGMHLEIEGQIATLPSLRKDSLLKALRYLIGLGHRRIGWRQNSKTRVEIALQDSIKTGLTQIPGGADCELTTLVSAGGSFRNGPAILKQWLSIPEAQRPTAIIMGTPAAMTFIAGLREQNLNCPEHISIIGIGDPSLNQIYYPQLTAIDSDQESKGVMAAELLIHQLCKKEEAFTPSCSVNEQFVIRHSCAPPHGT